MVPFLLQQVGLSGYGIIGLLSVLLSLSEVADLGLRQALGRELAEQVTMKDRQAFNELANTGGLFYVVIGGLLSVGCLVFAPICISFFKVPVELQPMAIRAVRIYGTGSFILSFVNAVFTAALTSSNRFDLRNNIESGCKIISSLVLIFVINTVDNGLYGWVYVMLAGQLLMVVLFYCFAVQACPWLEFHYRYIRINRARSLLKFGWKVYILQLTNLIAERSAPLVISRFFGPAGVALYDPGSRPSSILRPVVLTLSGQLHPLATRQHVENALLKQQRMLIDGTRYTLLMGVFFSTVLFVFAEPFCALWLGSRLGLNYLVVARVVQFWAIVDLMVCTASMQWPMMLAAKRLNTMMWIHGVTAILNIALSIYFIGHTSLGIPGVLLGAIVSGLVLYPVLIGYGIFVFKITIRQFFLHALARPLLLAGLLIPVAYIIRHVIAPAGYLSLIICGVTTGLVWLILMAGLAFTAQERRWAGMQIKELVYNRLYFR
jgi:O-antigen/teichoic acid export membrane protein